MKFLLDTHILLWSFFDTKKLSENIKNIILNEDHKIYYSPVNLWEISIKYGLGKLKLNGFTPEELFQEIKDNFFICKGIEPKTMATVYKLPVIHRDPFDRFLIWEAIGSGFALISADEAIKKYNSLGLTVIS
ncbi:MAG: type II toxin-antitoxin system VapC family toxin [Fibromonadales bacterium]|nr:type II toxin-antitoxin system VapC family toxin [Fibromonadales bacterium]